MYRYSIVKKYVAWWVVLLVLLPAVSASAHPMGNFSINQYCALKAQSDGIHLRYRIDFAEISTPRELQASKTTAGALSIPSVKQAFLDSHVPQWLSNLHLTIDGRPVVFEVIDRDVVVRPGSADLPTLLVTLDAVAPLPAMGHKETAVLVNENYAGRAGWREINVSAGPGCAIPSSTVPADDLSQELTAYPPAELQPPPQDEKAEFTMIRSPGIAPSSQPSIAAAPTGDGRPKDPFAALIAVEHVSPALALFSLAAAFVLGTFHALAPGHGKTVVAAYLVGSRGTARHAVLLGIIVTVTHTAAVFLLGLIVLFASAYVLPEKLYPWLGFISGMMILSIGASQVVRRWAAASVRSPDDHGHSHAMPDRVTFASLMALGVSGGIVPCPSALVVLLSAIALHRVAFGLILIVAFSIGLAAVLIAIGWAMLYARAMFNRLDSKVALLRRVPVFSSIAVALIGLVIAIQSLIAGKLL
jgi:ABC-type nickel/cobalt efflux system permease component RcnA